MKKQIVFVSIAAAALLLAACGQKDQSKALLTKADSALADANYAGAKAYYDAANTNKATSDAKNGKQAAGYFVKAESARASHDYSGALTLVKKAKGDAAVKTAKAKLKAAITKESDAYTKLFDAYQAAAAKQDTDAAGALTATNNVLNEDDLVKPAFRDLRIKVLLLQTQLKTTLGASTSSTSASSKTTSDTSSSGNDSESNENTTNNADTSITAADITKARAQLKAQGVDESAWSDNDVKGAIKNARAAGRTTVKESDMENYQ